MSTNTRTKLKKKIDKYAVLVLSISIIFSAIIWVWYDFKLKHIEQLIHDDKPEHVIEC